MDHTYTRHQLLRMERKVLIALKFNLSYCPPLHFVFLFASIARCSAMVNLNLSRTSSGDRLVGMLRPTVIFVLFFGVYATRWCGWLGICWSCLSWRASVWCSHPCNWQEQPSAWPAKFCRNPSRQRVKLPGIWPPAFIQAGMYVESLLWGDFTVFANYYFVCLLNQC